MINLKNLKSLFIKTDEEVVTENTGSTEQNKTTQQTTPATTTHLNSGIADQKILNALLSALETNNVDGFDFLEFKNSLKALSAMPLDEATRFRSAFATASTMGVTVAKLLESVDYYKKVLNEEKVNFESTLQNMVNQNVVNREKKSAELDTLIKKKSEQITALTQEISNHQQESLRIRGEISEAKSKIEVTRASFASTYDYVVQQMNDDAGKIKTYLAPTTN